MKILKALLALAVLLYPLVLSASGPIGVYAMIDKVLFEPNDQSPNRVQVWGAFAYVDGGTGGTRISEIQRGYMYFATDGPASAAVLNEWRDLKTVAGTGQAVGFGRWLYSGPFENLKPGAPPENLPHIFSGANMTDMRVRPAGMTPGTPALYQTNSGVVKLTDSGSHADIVRRLQAALK